MTLCSWCDNPATHLGDEPACARHVGYVWDATEPSPHVSILAVPMAHPTRAFYRGLVLFGMLMGFSWLVIQALR